jgi:SagB-type dehydrogenase family enzyme
MRNNSSEVSHAIEYHEKTKHSELSLQMSRHYLDFDNKPQAFKVYRDLPPIPLPQDFPIPSGDALACTSSIHPLQSAHHSLDICVLAQLLFFSAGITREMKFDSGTYYMRAASATGALYPIELYVVCKDIPGLTAGVYHFCPGDFSLTELCRGDFTRKLAAMVGGNHDILYSPITIAFTSLAWRNAWKYVDRSYRHWFWDSGVIAANLLATAVSAGLRPSLVIGFVDSEVNNLLLLEERKEAAVVLAPIGSSLTEPSRLNSLRPDPSPMPAAELPKILPLSKREEVYPEIWKLHEASSFAKSEEITKWLAPAKINNFNQEEKKQLSVVESKEEHVLDPKSSSDTGPLPKPPDTNTLGNVILRRGSTRRFSQSTISRQQLSSILYRSTRGVPLDFLNEKESLIEIYLIANAVEGLIPGHYFYDRRADSLQQLAAKKEIISRNESGYLCLGQSLFSDASAIFFLMTDLASVLKALGNRGYRACQFEAGVIAGKIYLSSYAQGLGASGSTFFDDAVTELFSPHARDKATMIAVGVGVSAYNARPGKLLAARLTRSELASQH